MDFFSKAEEPAEGTSPDIEGAISGVFDDGGDFSPFSSTPDEVEGHEDAESKPEGEEQEEPASESEETEGDTDEGQESPKEEVDYTVEQPSDKPFMKELRRDAKFTRELKKNYSDIEPIMQKGLDLTRAWVNGDVAEGLKIAAGLNRGATQQFILGAAQSQATKVLTEKYSLSEEEIERRLSEKPVEFSPDDERIANAIKYLPDEDREILTKALSEAARQREALAKSSGELEQYRNAVNQYAEQQFSDSLRNDFTSWWKEEVMGVLEANGAGGLDDDVKNSILRAAYGLYFADEENSRPEFEKYEQSLRQQEAEDLIEHRRRIVRSQIRKAVEKEFDSRKLAGSKPALKPETPKKKVQPVVNGKAPAPSTSGRNTASIDLSSEDYLNLPLAERMRIVEKRLAAKRKGATR